MKKNKIQAINKERIINKAVIDTCVLVEALIINYLEIRNNNDRISQEAINILKDYRNEKLDYFKFLNSIDYYYVTSHSIAEVHGVISKTFHLDEDLYQEFWEISINFLREKNISEKLIELISLANSERYKDCIYKIGFIDTGIIKIGIENMLPIITNDRKTLAKIALDFKYNDVIVPIDYLRG